MKTRSLGHDGLCEIVFPRHEDERGSFQRTWCANSFRCAGVPFVPVQASISSNPLQGTLRGLHYQAGTAAERKVVRCIHGAVFDVVLDIRPHSPTFGNSVNIVLDAVQGNAILIPQGFAHGFLTLTAGAIVEYLIEGAHDPSAARGYRWNDPAFAITWPAAPVIVSQRDRDWPLHV